MKNLDKPILEGFRPPTSYPSDEDLLFFVKEFRKGFLAWRSSKGECLKICSSLSSVLYCVFTLNFPMVKGDFILSSGDTLVHIWLKHPDGRILDPTADQLQQFGLPKMEEVYLGEKPDFYPRKTIELV